MNTSSCASWVAVREAEAMQRLTERLRSQFPELAAEDIEAVIQGRYRDVTTVIPADRQSEADYVQYDDDIRHDECRRA